MDKKQRRFWLTIVGLLIASAALGGWIIGRNGTSTEAPPLLPAETIEVEVTKYIETPGPERIVERVRWRTREVPVEKEVVKEIVRIICPVADEASGETTTPEVTAQVLIEAEKFEGVAQEGSKKLLFGWKGVAWCQIKGEGGEWLTLANEPFDHTRSEAQTTIAPVPVKRFRWRLELRAGLWKAMNSDLSDSGWGVGTTYYPWKRVGFYANYQGSTSQFIPDYEATVRGGSRVEVGGAVLLGDR